MLEAIRDRSQGWIAKAILILLIIPFALWGVDSYVSGGGQEPPAATVGDVEITQREFARTLQDQLQQLGGKVEDKALRQQVMDQLVNSRVLTQVAVKSGFSVLDPQIQSVLAGIELFQENGQLSESRVDAWLMGRGMSRGELLAMVGQDLLLKQVQIGYGEGAVIAKPGLEALAKLMSQQREVNEVFFDLKTYSNPAQFDEKTVADEYTARKTDFAIPAQVRVQYLVLSQSVLEEGVAIDEALARKYFDENQAQFQEPEQRRASHILIKLDAGADAAAKTAARQRAEDLLAEIRKTPAKFGDLARVHSQDPGSGANGGDLGVFSRDMMVKPFADAVWTMQPGQIHDLVETQFGYHIIRLDGIVGGAKMGFAMVKDEIVANLRREEAHKRFVESAERFSNMVYEQPDSLEPAAREFGLKIQESDWLGQGSTQLPMLSDERFLKAVMSDDAVQKKQNIEAIEVAPDTLISARVIEHKPAGVRPLAEVAGEIRARLAARDGLKLAVESGKKALADALAGNSANLPLSAPMAVSRMQSLSVPLASVRAIFSARTDKLPAWTGVETRDGYRLYRINRVAETAFPEPQLKAMRNDLRRLQAQEEMRAYLESAKARTKIKISPTALEPKAE
jgi:peptidyl-prolyl cis-trans isomerase D